jgi:uncharacterized repeat protein (TIGR02543 family)
MTSIHNFRRLVRARSFFALLLMSLVFQGVITTTPAVATTPTFHAVTFVENDSPTDPVFSSQTSNVQTTLTTFSNLNPAFVNSGFTFVDWNTSPDGTGTSVANGSSYAFTSSVALYAMWLKNNIAVTFIENDNPTDPVFADQIANSPTTLTLFAALSPVLANPGFSFVDWNTEANGGGVAYGDGSTYSFSTSIGLYAIWVPIPVSTLIFESTSGTGSVGSITNHVGGSTILPSGAGISNPGYTFVGWNTAPDGSGTEYAAGATYTFSGSQTLYAQWSPDTYVVTYSYSGGQQLIGSSDYVVGTTALTLPIPTFTGNTFDGWFSSQSGGTLVGVGGALYTPSSSMQLYAQWTLVVMDIFTFDSNGGIGTISSLTGADGSTAVLPTIDGVTMSGFAFSGWNTQADGSGTQYAEGASIPMTNSQTLYAQWTAGPSDTLTFDANGGSGSIDPINGTPGSTITLPDQSGLIHAGFELTHWNTNAKGSGTSYPIGVGFKLAGSMILYAQWSGHKLATLFGAVGTFKSGSSSLSASLKSQVNRIALTIKARKYVKIDLFGYSATTGLKSLNISLSRDRARNVATYLINRLRDLKVHGVSISSSGQGSIAGQSSREYSRVEVFGV